MNILLKGILILTILVSLHGENQGHTLKHFESEFKSMAHSYHAKDTSRAFSIAMKIFTSVEVFMTEAGVFKSDSVNL